MMILLSKPLSGANSLDNENASPTVTGNTLTGNLIGIAIPDSGDDVTGAYQGNTFTGNTRGISVFYQDNPVISGNTFSENDIDLSASGAIYNDSSWDASGVYTVSGLTINAGASLSIAPGSTVKVNNGGQIHVYGTLSASGVTFTWADGTNEWRGIEFSGSEASDSVLENCVIEHANGGYNNSAALNIHESSPTISGCTLRDSSAYYGIRLLNCSPEITGSSISGFNHGIWARDNTSASFSPTVTNNTFT